MGEGFKKQKRKFRGLAFLYSAVCGVSLGLLTAGAVYLGIKLTGIPFPWLYLILIVLAAAAIGFGVALLLLYPSERKIAVALDREYGLNEKVQTALAYQREEGPVIEVLQADTDARLLNLPRQKFDFRKVWQYFVIGILSVAVFATSLFIPAKIVEGEEKPTIDPDAEFEFTLEQMESLQGLVADVEASALTKEIKANVTDYLNILINNLMFAETNAEMLDYVNATVLTIDGFIKQPLSYKTIANALGSVGQNTLAKMIAEGVQVYKDFIIIDYSGAETFYNERATAVTDKIKEDLTDFLDLLMNGESEAEAKAVKDGEEEGEGEPEEGETPEGEGDGEEGDNGDEDVKMGVVEKTYTDIYLALNLSTAANDDSLRTLLFNFAKDMAQNENQLTNNTALYFDIKFKAELAEQAYRLAMNKYVTNRLRELFGLNIPEDENFIPTYSQTGDNDHKGGDITGGFGKGDMLYGSDDPVYDPITGEYRPYGEIINDYYAIVESMLRDGTLTEEQQAIIRAYFEILFSGIKEEK